ncbi:MAG TPA: hypothetical protein VES39_04735, partial [Rhodospirillales bacterium]|nr:hypothetical protein [Rhodospirillales bacterium]
YGEAFLRPRHQGPIIGVAGGTGVAPLLSIVATALAAGPGRDVALYVGAREEGDLYVAARLTRLAARHPGFRWIPVLSKPQASAARRTGLVTDALSADIAGGAALPLATAKAYIAGPPAMVTAAAALLQSAGIGVADIHADGLRPPPPADEPVWCDGSGAPTANEPFNRAR